jgi:hypothetical protein
MMKKTLIYLMIFCFPFLKVNAQEIPENDKALIDNFIKSITSVEKVKIESDTLARVFKGSFYTATTVFAVDEGTSSCSEYWFVINNGKLTQLEMTSSKKKLDGLFSLLKENVQIKNESDARIFETALDKIYPISWSEVEAKKHMKTGNKWYFIRGKFFDSVKGFIITLDQNSRITQIDYDLEIVIPK